MKRGEMCKRDKRDNIKQGVTLNKVEGNEGVDQNLCISIDVQMVGISRLSE